MRPYEELCRVTSLTDLRLIKTVLNKNHVEYFVKGDPLNQLLLHINEEMQIMVKYNELPRARQLLAGAI